MENNPELRLAWQFIENTGTHLFLTGKAGTGKTTFLRQLKAKSPKRMVVLAPTGIAAINAGGVTIHSFFQLPLAPFVPEATFSSAQAHYRFSKEKRRIIRSMDLLVIDEVSMVRADLLDAVDAALRRYRERDKPFGGVQLLLIGDLQQLAPVVKESEWELLRKYYDAPYFFASRALKSTTYLTIELKQVYRQSDAYFLSLLNKIRENRADEAVLQALNRRCLPGFKPRKEDGYIRLTTHNSQAQRVNDRELALLPGKAYRFRAETEGDFPEYAYPADEVLTVKAGAQIMFLKNDTSPEKRYYNGMIGEVAAVDEESMQVRGKESPDVFRLLPEEWTNSKYVLNEETKEITEEVEGVFRQYPVRLAWAITIHKSQGLTFEHAIIDAQNSFAHGQAYVALSRCKTLEGLVLETPLRREAIISDSVVDAFTKEAESHAPGTRQLHDMQRAYFLELVGDLFSFYAIEQAYKQLVRLIDESLYRLYPRQLEACKALLPHLQEKVVDVARRFANQYTRLISNAEEYASDPALQARLSSGAAYFRAALEPFRTLWEQADMPVDNKVLKKQLDERMQAFGEALAVKEALLDWQAASSFTVTGYLKRKAQAMLDAADGGAPRGAKEKRKRASRAEKRKVEVPKDILHPELYRTLAAWREAKAAEAGQPLYVVMQQKALMGIANLLPDTPQALVAVPYFGTKGMEKYGAEILAMVRRYMEARGVARPELRFVPVEQPEAAEKKPTREVSLELFRSGRTIEEIARERDLAPGTIVRHLETYVHTGEIALEQVVPAERIRKIRRYMAAHPEAGMVEVKAALDEEVSYADIRFVRAAQP